MKTIKTLAELKETAMALTQPTKVRWPQYNQVETLIINTSELVENTYYTNNSVIAFLTDDTFYVIPYAKQFIDILLENGFTSHAMRVPFSNWDYPIDYESKWNDLKRLAKECA